MHGAEQQGTLSEECAAPPLWSLAAPQHQAQSWDQCPLRAGLRVGLPPLGRRSPPLRPDEGALGRRLASSSLA